MVDSLLKSNQRVNTVSVMENKSIVVISCFHLACTHYSIYYYISLLDLSKMYIYHVPYFIWRKAPRE